MHSQVCIFLLTTVIEPAPTYSAAAFGQDSALDTTASWASCSSWVSSSQWHSSAHTHAAFLERSYSSDLEYSPASPFVVPSLSRDSSISPQSNPQLCTPNASEVHLEPAIADPFTEVLRGFDHDVWMLPEKQQNHCNHTPEVLRTSQAPNNHFHFTPECTSLLSDLMQLSGQNDAVFSALVEAQPQFASLPPSAFELDQSPRTISQPLELHHPRPRRPFVPRWQCDPDFDFDQFTSSLASQSTFRSPLDDAHASDQDRFSHPSSTVPDDVSSDDELDDFMDEDSDMDIEDDYQLEDHSPFPSTHPHCDAEVYSPCNLVGPSVCLGTSVGALGPQALLFQSISESVKSLYSSSV